MKVNHSTEAESNSVAPSSPERQASLLHARIRRIRQQEAIERAKSRALEREFSGTDAIGMCRTRRVRSYAKASTTRLTAPFVGAPFITKSYGPYRGADGRRSFHFSHIAIPKTKHARTLPGGTKIRPGAAKDAAQYNMAMDRPGYLLGDRVQCDNDGNPVIETNISNALRTSQIVAEVLEFWELVEPHEREPSPDKAILNFARHPRIWRRIANDPGCDPAVVHAYRSDPASKAAKVTLTHGAQLLAMLMVQHGFGTKKQVASNPSGPNRPTLDAVKWKHGRGGRTQIRQVIALPHEFTAAQRHEALKAICDQLRRRGVMFFAVIHEPTAANDARNFHIHIDIYDRPCRRMTGTRADLVNVSDTHRDGIALEIDKGQWLASRGQWDFTVKRSYKSASRNRREHYPFKANKNRELNDIEFPLIFRREIEQAVNAIAIRSKETGYRPVYDARTYAEMGIDKEPDEPLGARGHALVQRGIPTPASLRNEERHAQAASRRIGREYDRRIAEIHRYGTRLELAMKTTPQGQAAQAAKVEHDVQLNLETLRAAAEAQHEFDRLALGFERIWSSSALVAATADRIIEAGGDRDGEFAQRREQAAKWLIQAQDDHRYLADLYDGLSAAKADQKALHTAVESGIAALSQCSATVNDPELFVDVEGLIVAEHYAPTNVLTDKQSRKPDSGPTEKVTDAQTGQLPLIVLAPATADILSEPASAEPIEVRGGRSGSPLDLADAVVMPTPLPIEVAPASPIPSSLDGRSQLLEPTGVRRNILRRRIATTAAAKSPEIFDRPSEDVATTPALLENPAKLVDQKVETRTGARAAEPASSSSPSARAEENGRPSDRETYHDRHSITHEPIGGKAPGSFLPEAQIGASPHFPGEPPAAHAETEKVEKKQPTRSSIHLGGARLNSTEDDPRPALRTSASDPSDRMIVPDAGKRHPSDPAEQIPTATPSGALQSGDEIDAIVALILDERVRRQLEELPVEERKPLAVFAQHPRVVAAWDQAREHDPALPAKFSDFLIYDQDRERAQMRSWAAHQQTLGR